MLMDYNKIIRNEIDESYSNGKTDGYMTAYKKIDFLYEQYRNSIKTTEKELEVFNNIKEMLQNSSEFKS